METSEIRQSAVETSEIRQSAVETIEMGEKSKKEKRDKDKVEMSSAVAAGREAGK